MGFWGLDVLEEVGGVSLLVFVLVGVNEEVGWMVILFMFLLDLFNFYMLLVVVNED